MTPRSNSPKRAPVDPSDERWVCVYSDSYVDSCGREVAAAVSVRVTDRHGNAVAITDRILVDALVAMTGHLSVF